MKKLFFIAALCCAAVFSSCNEFDDSLLWEKINDHEKRIAALEELCKQMNTNISALQTIVTALQDNDYVTSVAPITKEGETIGYTITFSKSDPITIYHGKDGHTPQIGIKPDTDNIYYWTLDGEWMLDSSGNKIQAQGITPKLKVEDDYWYISYDNGSTWEQLGKATGEDGDSFFKDVTTTDDYVIFTLADGTELTVPRTAQISGNKIYYTTSDDVKIFPNSTDHLSWGAILVSNVYTNGQGVLTFDDAITKIKDDAFGGITNLTSITIPDSVTKIGEKAFSGCTSLASITIPDSVTEIGDWAFSGCISLTSITIPDSVAAIGSSAFGYCTSLTSITIPDSVTSIRGSAFADCTSLTSVIIPDSVTEIGWGAFSGCSSLTSVTIGDSVTSIGNRAFDKCSNMRDVYCKPIVPPSVYYEYSGYVNDLPEYSFPNNRGMKIYVPSESYELYTQYYSYSNGLYRTNWYKYESYVQPYDFE